MLGQSWSNSVRDPVDVFSSIHDGMLYTLQPVRLQSECLARLFGNYDNSLDPLPLLPNLRDPSARNIGMFGLSVDLSAAPFDCSVFARRVFLLTEHDSGPEFWIRYCYRADASPGCGI